MRIIFDGNLPRDLGRLLSDHSVQTIHERRWSDLDDGPLLDASAGECDVFMTMDQSLRYQQTLRGRPFGVVVLRARSNRLADLMPLVPALQAKSTSSAPNVRATWARSSSGEPCGARHDSAGFQ